MRMSNLYKAPKGLIRVEANVESNIIISIRLTGDFFMVPEGALWLLERHLRGIELNLAPLSNAINIFYALGIETPMLSENDLVSAIIGVKSETSSN